MAGNLGSLIVELAMNSAKFVKGIDDTNKRLDKFAKRSRQVAKLAGAAFAGISVGRLVDNISDVVDKYALMEGRLKLVQREGENLAATQAKLFDLAQRTRQGVGETVDFYTQLARATKSLGTDQETLIKTTEAINKAIIISGASAQSANAALFQLQQGIASGTLRGQELNSVLEQTPRVAEAIADGLGVTIGELRKLGEQGQLTAEAVIGAITKQADVLDKEFAGVPVTVAQNMQLLTNEFEKAAKGAGGLNYVINKSIESLTNWARVYNATFNPTGKEKLRELQEEYRILNKQIEEGAFQGERINKEKRAELSRIREELNALNERIIAEQKLEAIEARRARGGGSSKDPLESGNRLAALVRQEELMRSNLSIREAANDELVRTKALYDGNIISLEAYIEKTKKLQETIRGATPETVEGFSYSDRLAADKEAQEARLAADREFRLQRVRQAAEEKEQLEAIEKQKTSSILNSTASLFGSLASIVGNGSKKQFELSKKLARAEVLISTYTSAQKAYEWASKFGGPGAGAAAAAAAIAAGLARLTAINRTSYNSSASAAANSGAGSYVPAPGPGPVTPGGASANGAGSQIFVIMPNGGASQVHEIPELQIESIATQLSDLMNRGDFVLFRRESRQAAEAAEAITSVVGGN